MSISISKEKQIHFVMFHSILNLLEHLRYLKAYDICILSSIEWIGVEINFQIVKTDHTVRHFVILLCFWDEKKKYSNSINVHGQTSKSFETMLVYTLFPASSCHYLVKTKISSKDIVTDRDFLSGHRSPIFFFFFASLLLLMIHFG